MLVPGFVGPMEHEGFPTGGTVSLITGDPHVIVDTGDVSQRERIVGALARLRVAPDRIGWVINTHGHLDHVGNNNLFPGATFVLAGDVARHGKYGVHDFAAGPLSIGAGADDDAITVLLTPGHTDHDLTVLVTTPDGVVAIAGDLFEHAEDDHDGSWQRWSQDVARQRQSRDRVRSLAAQIVPGHGDRFRVAR